MQDVVDVIGTAEKEAKDINALFAIPTFKTIYHKYASPPKVLDDKKLSDADRAQKAIIDDPTIPLAQKNEARRDAFITRISKEDRDLAAITKRIVEVG